jgi:hypothetical protein
VPAVGEHLALALATGVLDGIKRDFRGVFEVLRPLREMLGIAETRRVLELRRILRLYGRCKAWEGQPLPADPIYTDVDQARMAEQGANDLCLRIFRGTSGQTPGAVLLKDTVYDIGLRRVLKELKVIGPGIVNAWLLGKFDASNPEHVALLAIVPEYRLMFKEIGLLDSAQAD